MSLVQEVRALIERAAADAAGTARGEMLQQVLARLDAPVRVALAGRVKAGKSTLLNALIGEELAQTDAGECTRIVTWYRDGVTYRVRALTRDGAQHPLRFTREHGPLDIDLSGLSATDVERLDVDWPSARLRDVTLIDTPGIDSMFADVSLRTFDALASDDEVPAEADAVVYLMRHLHGSDVRFLEAFHDDELAHPSPVNAIGVLSRADELGAGRLDAMDSAGRIAARYSQDAKLRRLCQTVVPVAGLLAQAAAALREADFRSFGQIADLPQDDRDLLLLSSDHFLADNPTLTLMPVERAELLDSFGLFGVRQAIDSVVRGDARTSAELASALTDLSGIGALRTQLVTRFGQRAAVLKARSALNALEAGLSENDPLAAAVERIRAGAHELVELRLLNQVRTGALALSSADVDDVERLVGGGAPAVRLGLGADADPNEVRSALFAALDRWQRKMESPVSGQAVKDAARTVVRTCEGMLADLPVDPGISV